MDIKKEETEVPKEAQKESFLVKLGKSFVGIVKQPCARWILCGGFFRFFGGYAFIYYNPSFFTLNFPDYSEQFAATNAILTASLSFISGMAGGYIGDNVRKNDPMTKAYLCSFASLLSAPFLFVAYFISKNFWVSMAMVGANYLIGEGWSSSCFAMLLDVTDPKTQGLTVNVYFLFCMTAAMISTALLDVLGQAFDTENDPAMAGYILGIAMMASLIGSGIAFLISGFHYRKFMCGE